MSVRHCPALVTEICLEAFEVLIGPIVPELAIRFVTAALFSLGPLMTKLSKSSRS